VNCDIDFEALLREREKTNVERESEREGLVWCDSDDVEFKGKCV